MPMSELEALTANASSVAGSHIRFGRLGVARRRGQWCSR
jgi:hypothetical protein